MWLTVCRDGQGRLYVAWSEESHPCLSFWTELLYATRNGVYRIEMFDFLYCRILRRFTEIPLSGEETTERDIAVESIELNFPGITFKVIKFDQISATDVPPNTSSTVFHQPLYYELHLLTKGSYEYVLQGRRVRIL